MLYYLMSRLTIAVRIISVTFLQVLQTVKEALLGKELIPEFTIDGPKKAVEEKRPDGRPSGSMNTGRTSSYPGTI